MCRSKGAAAMNEKRQRRNPMTRLTLVLLACLFVASPGPSPTEQPTAPVLTPWQDSWGPEPSGVAFHVCVQEQDGVSYISVLGPKQTLTPMPTEHIKTQVRNALKFHDLASDALVLFPGEPEKVRKGPGAWDEPRSSKGYCRRCVCAEALYNSNKQFSGCSVTTCDGCQVCRPCEAQ
jgi:hypothetical protein